MQGAYSARAVRTFVSYYIRTYLRQSVRPNVCDAIRLRLRFLLEVDCGVPIVLVT